MIPLFENATLFVVNNGPSLVILNDECVPFLSRPNNDIKLFNYILKIDHWCYL